MMGTTKWTRLSAWLVVPVLLVTRTADGQEEEEFKTVVTAKRLPEDAFLSDRSVYVVDEDEIEESAGKSTPEVLQDAPGVFVQHTNHGGGSPIMRGMIGPQLLIMIDGVRFSNSVYRTGPVQYLNLLDQMSLEKLELLRGPGSVLYGSDAMGGVIQAFPLDAPDLRWTDGIWGGGDVLLRHSTANTGLVGHAHAGAGAGGLGILGGATLKGFGDLRGGGDVGKQVYSGHDAWSGIANLTYRFSEGFARGWRLKLVYLSSSIEDAGRTDKLADTGTVKIYDNTDHLVYGRLRMHLRPILTEADLTLSWQNFFERTDTVKPSSSYELWLSATRDLVKVSTLGLDLQLTTRLVDDRLRLQYGGMWYRDWVDSWRLRKQIGTSWTASEDRSFPKGSTYDNHGAFLMATGTVMKLRQVHVLELEAGYRFHGMAASAPATEGVPDVEFTSLGHVLIGGLQYVHSDLATLALTFSQGFRAPNLAEAAMLGDTGKYWHVPNDDLSPESSNTFELLGRTRIGPITLGWSAYLSLLRDIIKRQETVWEDQTVIGGKDVVHNVNGGEGILLGTEVVLGVALGRGVSVRGHLTYTWGEEEVPDGPDLPLTRIPPAFGLLALRYDTRTFGPWSAHVETYLRFASKQFRLSPEDLEDARIPEGGTPGWWTWNIRMGMEVHDRVVLNLAIENLLDQRYRYHGSGIWAPGVNGVLTLELYL